MSWTYKIATRDGQVVVTPVDPVGVDDRFIHFDPNIAVELAISLINRAEDCGATNLDTVCQQTNAGWQLQSEADGLYITLERKCKQLEAEVAELKAKLEAANGKA